MSELHQTIKKACFQDETAQAMFLDMADLIDTLEKRIAQLERFSPAGLLAQPQPDGADDTGNL